METDYLRELTGVVESGSFADTSEELFLSETTLYRHMKAIEEKLDADGPLFYRTPQGMRLTPLGGIIHRYAEKILALEDACRDEIRSRSAAEEAVLRVAAIDTNAYPQISDALACFGEKYPDCRTNVTLAHTSYNLERLRRFECDFAFAILEEGRDTGFCQEAVLEDPLTAIIYRNHPLSQEKGPVSMEELVKQPLLISGENSFTNRLCRRMFEELGIRPKVVLTSYNRATLKNMAEEELGIALMLKKQAETLHLKNSVLRPVTPASMGRLTLLYRESALEKAVNQDFLRCVRTEKEYPEKGEERRKTALRKAAAYIR